MRTRHPAAVGRYAAVALRVRCLREGQSLALRRLQQRVGENPDVSTRRGPDVRVDDIAAVSRPVRRALRGVASEHELFRSTPDVLAVQPVGRTSRAETAEDDSPPVGRPGGCRRRAPGKGCESARRRPDEIVDSTDRSSCRPPSERRRQRSAGLGTGNARTDCQGRQRFPVPSRSGPSRRAEDRVR